MISLIPAYKDYLWGGDFLQKEYGKDPTLPVLAESWELSIHPDGLTRVGSGEYAGRTLREYLEARPLRAGESPEECMPVLVKLIDAHRPLSVQVHPDDSYARTIGEPHGKTELWHVLAAGPDAFIYLGTNREISREEFKSRIQDGTVEQVLRKIGIRAGETYYVPAGMLHAIGGGAVLCEVQQSSDITYRVYDYGRVDAAGNARPLHIEQAMEAADLRPSELSAPPGAWRGWNAYDRGSALFTDVRCPYFTLRRLRLKGTAWLRAEEGDFLHVLCVEGQTEAVQPEERISLSKGSGLLLTSGEEAGFSGAGQLLLISRGTAS